LIFLIEFYEKSYCIKYVKVLYFLIKYLSIDCDVNWIDVIIILDYVYSYEKVKK